MKLNQDHFELVAAVLAKLPTDAAGTVTIDARALSDRFAHAMAPHAPNFDRDRMPLIMVGRCEACGKTYPCDHAADMRRVVRTAHRP